MPTDLQSQTGVIWAYRFDTEGRPSLIARDTLPDLAPDEGFVWLHLDLVHTRAQSWIGEQELPDAAQETLLSQETHQRLDHSAQLAWGVSHDLIRSIADKSDSVGALRWVIGDSFLLTGRREALHSIRMTAEALNRGEPAESPSALFEQIIEYIIDDITDSVVRLVDETDSVEDQILLDRLHDGPQRVGAIRRTAVRLHRQLSGLHVLFRRFAETQSGRSAPDAVKATAARLLQRVDTLHHDVQSVQDRARLLQDEIAARSANRTNRQLYVLSILTALFLPATFITGLFGINVKGLPWVESEAGAIYVSLACMLAALLTLILLRRRGVIGD
ncbi:magnesium transporter CorA [Bosea sp. SSUT16]|jgi:magnesium transporter/zinc transporter|uniref:Magnesium transporter CorA n=1 Tax=Bosea spartocytisi TaxID=2773451 RepID=A0A927E8P8_9HYPH|nr:CorA family divalent cation transporter [Bosea spartocytisi]MBD3846398.1 magnesium transporter CorA [Bosea spartocytisi]MCT4471944.1 magnesium transporter CorA [Bosea spartocytisi]